MFGDILHGAILFIFSTYLCFSKPAPGSAISELCKIKYLLLLMGFFSTFNGFIYNDYASIPLKTFGDSCYKITHVDEKQKTELTKDCVYPVGVDPTWYLGNNELQFMNSIKMKLSVILGVSQMSLGIFMKGLNAVYFKKPIDFIFEFIPQIVLLLVLFGFMDLLIILKWLTDWQSLSNAKPPSVISSIITMCLNMGYQQEGREETELIPN